jgi:hypothetical protein
MTNINLLAVCLLASGGRRKNGRFPAGIIAVDHDLAPLVALMVGIGIPLSFVTLHFWHLFLEGIA